MALKISESAAVQMPMKTVASLIAMIAVGTWAYFGIQKIKSTLYKDRIDNKRFRS